MKKIALLILLFATLNAQLLSQEILLEPHWWFPTDGQVHAIVEDENNVYLGGSFTSVGPLFPYGGVMSAADGKPNFQIPFPNGTVNAVIPDGSGGWYIGGTFTAIGGLPRNSIAHLDNHGQVSPLFENEGFNGSVDALFQQNGNLYVGGRFTAQGQLFKGNGTVVDQISAEPDFNFLAPNGRVRAAEPDGAGGWYIGGDFSEVGGFNRSYLARLNSDGTLHPWSPELNGSVHTIKLKGQDLYIGGEFTEVGAQTRYRLAKFSAVDGLLTSFLAGKGFNNNVLDIEVNNQSLFAVGQFDLFGEFYFGNGGLVDETIGLPDFNYMAPNHHVNTSIPDGYGGWYIGGGFTEVGGIPRNYLARINADGTLHNWNPNANSWVRTLALDGGVLYVGGDFTNVGGASRSRIAALDAETGVASSWNPGASSSVHTIAISSGIAYVGGDFTTFDGQTRNRLAAFELTTGDLTSWNPNSGGIVFTIAIHSGEAYIGGSFTTMKTQNRNRIAAVTLAGDGTLTTWDPGANNIVRTIAIASGIAYVGGNFTTIAGQSRNHLAAFELSSGNLTTWNPDASAVVNVIAIHSGMAYVGGSFREIGGLTRGSLASVSLLDGTIGAWNPNAASTVNTIQYQAGGFYVGGAFKTLGGSTRSFFAEINLASGDVSSFDMQFNGFTSQMISSGNTLYVVGQFTAVNGQPRHRVAALDISSETLLAWNPNVSGSLVSALTVSGDYVYLGGTFTAVGGQPRINLAAVHSSTGNVSPWNPGANSNVFHLHASGAVIYALGDFTEIGGADRRRIAAINISDGLANSWAPIITGQPLIVNTQTDGTPYVGGIISYFGGQIRNNLAAFDIATAQITAWNPNVGGSTPFINTIAGSSGTIYVGGWFTNIGSVSRTNIASIEELTGFATTWIANANSTVNAILVDGSSLYVGGNFSNINSQTRNRIAKLDLTTGDVDLNWNPNANSTVNALLVDGSSLYVGGAFTNINSQTRNRIAKLDLTTGDVDLNWNPNANFSVNTLAIEGNTLYVGGGFWQMSSQPRSRLAAIDKSTGALLTWNPNANSTVNAIALQSGDIYAGGTFRSVGGVTRNRFVALNTITGQPTELNLDFNGDINALGLSGETLYAGGNFSDVNGNTRNRLASINTQTETLNAFDPNINGNVLCIQIDETNIYIGGAFTEVGGLPRNRLAVFNKTNEILDGWHPNFNNWVNVLDLADGVLYAGGRFTEVATQQRDRLAAFDIPSQQLKVWAPGVNGEILALKAIADDVYIGGAFLVAGGAARHRLAAINASTGLTSSWNPGADANVTAINYRENTIFVGGNFSQLNGQVLNLFGAFDLTTGESISFNSNFSASGSSGIRAIHISPKRVFAGGGFLKINGEDMQNLAVFSSERQWTGKINSDWNNPGNWTNKAIPKSGDDAMITAMATYQPTISENFLLRELTITPGARMMVNPNNVLELSNLNNAGELGLNASPSGDYSQLKITNSYSGAGMVKMERYLSSGWHNLALPFETTPASTFGNIGSDAPNGNILTNNFTYWDATNGNWESVENNSVLIGPERGYSAFSGDLGICEANEKISPKGLPALSTQPLIAFNTTPTIWNQMNGGPAEGWNLIGNPLLATLDFSTLTMSDIEDAFYIWNPNKLGGAGYDAWSAALPGTGPFIPPLQSFWVRATGPTAQMDAISYQNSALNEAPIFRKQHQISDHILLSVLKQQDNDIADALVIALSDDESITDGFDNGWDAHKLIQESRPNLYTFGMHQPLAINAIPYTNGSGRHKIIPLGFEAPISSYKIALEDSLITVPLSIVLEDLEKKIFHDLIKEPYSFTHQQTNNNRFKLHIGVEIDQLKPTQPLDAWIWNGQIQLQSHSYSGAIDWILVDMKGADVLRSPKTVNITIGEQLTLPLHRKLPVGVYLLQLKTDDSYQHIKVLIE